MPTLYVTLKYEECYKCGILFGVTEDFQRRRKDLGDTFYCPSGHGQAYTESNVSKLQKQLERTTDQLQDQRLATMNERHAKERAQNSLKRIKKRVENGVCPHCKRHFPDLESHMESKHKPGRKKKGAATKK